MSRSALISLALMGAVAISGCAGTQSGGAKAPDSAESSVETERDVYRRAFGGLAAGYLFQTHLSIGTTADLFGKKVYAADEVDALMDTTIGMGKSVAQMLGEVGKLQLGPGDRKTVDEMLEVNRLLAQQAGALKTFVRQQTRENAARFAEHRESTWVRLQALLNIRVR
jgi:hypothetical protein